MKSLLNFFRVIIYVIINFLFVGMVFGGLDTFCGFVLETVGKIQHSINPILFWVLFFLVGTSIISLAFAIFKMIVSIFVGLVTRISPYRKFTLVFTYLNAIINFLLFTYLVWWKNYDHSSFFGVIVSLVVTVMGLGVASLIFSVTTNVLNHRDPSRLSDGTLISDLYK